MGSRCVLGSLYSPYQRQQRRGKKLLLRNRCVSLSRGSACCGMWVVLAPSLLFTLFCLFYTDRWSQIREIRFWKSLRAFLQNRVSCFFKPRDYI